MVLIKHNSLKSDISFNPIFIPGFSGSRFLRVQVFQSPGFSGSRFFRVQIQALGPESESKVRDQGPGSWSRVWVQVLEVADQRYLKARDLLQKNFLWKLILRFSTPESLSFVEQMLANYVHFVCVFFENRRVFYQIQYFLQQIRSYIAKTNSAKLYFTMFLPLSYIATYMNYFIQNRSDCNVLFIFM